jgi:hypothetical protein
MDYGSGSNAEGSSLQESKKAEQITETSRQEDLLSRASRGVGQNYPISYLDTLSPEVVKRQSPMAHKELWYSEIIRAR